MIIVVSGIPRSGTSMMMGMLEAGGVPCVYEQVVNEANPGGFFECQAGLNGDFTDVPDGHAVKCLEMLPLADRSLDARVIIMRRDLPTALASVNRVMTMRDRPHRDLESLQGSLDSIRLWCAGKPHVEVWKEDVHRNTAYECQRVARLLDMDLDLAAMAGVPSPRSY